MPSKPNIRRHLVHNAITQHITLLPGQVQRLPYPLIPSLPSSVFNRIACTMPLVAVPNDPQMTMSELRLPRSFGEYHEPIKNTSWDPFEQMSDRHRYVRQDKSRLLPLPKESGAHTARVWTGHTRSSGREYTRWIPTEASNGNDGLEPATYWKVSAFCYRHCPASKTSLFPYRT